MSFRLPTRSSQTLNQGEVVVLRGLPTTATLKEVQDCLGSLRPVSIDFHHDDQGKFRGTVFVRLSVVEDAMRLVETGCSLEGKRIKAELMHNSASKRNSIDLHSDKAQVDSIEALITSFVNSEDQECYLPATLNADQRKLAHSLAEKYCLTHLTTSPEGALESSKTRVILLTKHRSPSMKMGSMSSPSHKLSPDAAVFTPLSALAQGPSLARLPSWLQEKPSERSRTSFVISESVRQAD